MVRFCGPVRGGTDSGRAGPKAAEGCILKKYQEFKNSSQRLSLSSLEQASVQTAVEATSAVVPTTVDATLTAALPTDTTAQADRLEASATERMAILTRRMDKVPSTGEV